MMLVDKETGKGYVEMEKVHRDKKEYASKAVGGTALGLSIGALGLREVIVNKLVEFYTGKIDELANQNALIMIFRPFVDKAADKSIGKVDKFLKMIQEEDGTVDIEPLLGKMTDNLIVAATKEYPDLFGGVTIGNGKIKIGVPGIDKDIVLEAADIDHFKSCLK